MSTTSSVSFEIIRPSTIGEIALNATAPTINSIEHINPILYGFTNGESLLIVLFKLLNLFI